MSARILQLSDFHLFADPEERLKGVPTWHCLSDVLSVVRREFSDADFFILSGDLASDEQEGSYRQVRRLWDDLLPRCRVIPGNHDDQAAMRTVFPDLITGETDRVTFSVEANRWRLIGLDSRETGQVRGRISPEQLVWLATELEAHRDQPTLLFLHHPPIRVNSAWLDRIMLQQADRFAEVVGNAPQVRAIFTGHIHHEFEGRLNNIPVLTAPSTAVQFAPATEQPVIENVPAGFRVIELDGRDFCSRVVRLPEVKYEARWEA